MKCPECDGKGGGVDWLGEWDDCPCCQGAGTCTTDRHQQWRAEIAAMDAEIDRQMAAEAKQ